MRNILALFLVAISIISCTNEEEKKFAVVSGKIKDYDLKEIKISYWKTIDYESIVVKIDSVKDDGTFHLEYDSPENVDGVDIHFGNKVYYKLFLSNGDSLNIDISMKKDSSDNAIFTGDKAEFSSYIEKKLKTVPDSYELYQKSQDTNFVNFFTYLDSLKDKEIQLLEKEISKKTFPEQHDVFLYQIITNYKYDKVDYMLSMDLWFEKVDLNVDSLLSELLKDYDLTQIKYPGSIKINNFISRLSLLHYWNWKDKQDSVDYDLRFSNQWDIVSDKFTGKSLDIAFTKDYISLLEDSDKQSEIDSFQVYFNKYKELSKDSVYIDYVQKKIEKRSKLMPGNPAPELVARDIEGNIVKISDFKGKVVYLDFWSTGCYWCLQEHPDAKVLMEEYKEKDIVFLYVAFQNEYVETWKKYLEEKELTGVQLVCNEDEEDTIRNDYYVKGIPHYFLIDRDGKIITSNALRPSNKKIREKLNEALEI